MAEAQVAKDKDAELTSIYSKQLESAQKLVNQVANKYEIEIQLRFVNGNLQAYVKCSAGSTKCNDNNLADLTKNFANEFASQFTKGNKEAAFAGLAFVEGGATAEQVKKVAALSNGELDKFNEQMKSKFENATVNLGDAAARSETAGGEGQAEDWGRHVSLISRQEIDRFLENARRWGVEHLKEKGEIREEDKKLWEEAKKKGGAVDTAGVSIRVHEDYVEVAIATTGEARGVGERKSMFKITLSREAYEKIRESAPEFCKKLSEGLVGKDSKINEKALKEFLYVHRDDKKVGEAIRNKMIEIFGKEEYAKMEAEAQKEYEKDFPGKKMSKTGFAIGLFYAVVTAKSAAGEKKEKAKAPAQAAPQATAQPTTATAQATAKGTTPAAAQQATQISEEEKRTILRLSNETAKLMETARDSKYNSLQRLQQATSNEEKLAELRTLADIIQQVKKKRDEVAQHNVNGQLDEELGILDRFLDEAKEQALSYYNKLPTEMQAKLKSSEGKSA